ncbi:hydroxyethylthiazole kinase [Dietzia sp. B32]|uniref:hydroxyethylthiazole kinase n=1 Tax=Dietzia sp. B32 TaxID=2915130 RepID=UPI0021AD55CA|nr:hydroxyethylthiazole kinase [Dietzia sp. B32]UVE93756.1 hydroxyethylthiazole kinase [Dietzia sp. B32]
MSPAADHPVDVAALVTVMRETGPLVHCLTNSVVRQITADVLLAAGAAPAMVDHPEEAGDFAAIASGVLINVGNPTAEQVEGMHAAIAAARAAGTPWVLDPVAVGGLVLRTGLATDWLEAGPAAIRANASETIALAGTGAGGRGVDSTEDVLAAEPAARDLSARSGAVVAVTGPRDLVVSRRVVTQRPGDPTTDADTTDAATVTRATWIESGHPLLQKVIGTGCALGALTAAYLGAARSAGIADHDAVVAAHAHAGAAGTVAGRTAAGPGSFAVAWLDALYTLTPEEIADLVTVTGA